MSHQPVRNPRRAATASFIGSTLEYYDYMSYGNASALAFAPLFFPASNPAVATLLAMATFAVGYLVRPIGAVVIGHFGDRVGRKRMLILTLIGMGICTFLIGCLPTYASIGIAAPILLLVLRVLQGLFVSGEAGGATTLALEHAPDHKRAFYASWVNQGAAAGVTLSSLLFLALSALPDDAFLSWGWRIPFLLSVFVVIGGVIIRSGLPESPAFVEEARAERQPRIPIVRVLRENPTAILRIIGIAVLTVIVPINSVFALSFGVQAGISRTAMIVIGLVSSVFAIGTQPLFAALSDRVGRKPVFYAGGVVAMVFVFVLFGGLMAQSVIVAAIGGVMLMSVGYAMCNAVFPAISAEMFPTETRYTGVAVAGQLGQILPGFAPAIAAALIAGGGSGWSVAVFTAVCALFGMLVLATARETSRLSSDTLGIRQVDAQEAPKARIEAAS